MPVESDHKSKSDDADEAAFNETLKRMLQTPPKPHEKPEKGDSEPTEKDRR